MKSITTVTTIFGSIALAIATIILLPSTLAFWENNKVHQNMQPILNTALVPVLSDIDVERLMYGQQEERLARDVYLTLFQQYGLQVFSNIARSENHHVDLIGNLLRKYNIEQTEGYGKLQSTYDKLIQKGSQSLQDAIEVGIAIEILDIKDLDKTLSETDNQDIKAVYGTLRQGSIRHLAAFVRNLQQNGFTTKLSWKEFISSDKLKNYRYSDYGMQKECPNKNGDMGHRKKKRGKHYSSRKKHDIMSHSQYN